MRQRQLKGRSGIFISLQGDVGMVAEELSQLHLTLHAPPAHLPLPPTLTLRACTTVSSYREVAGMADGLCFAPP